MLSRIVANTFLSVKERPILFRAYLRCLHPGSLAYLPGPETDLLIAGYQRSGNTFATKMMRKIDLPLRISSHAHAVAELKIAKDRGLPAIVMIREPGEAIASSVVKHRARRFRSQADFHVSEYVRYYSYVLREKETFFVLNFSEATGNPEIFLRLHRHFFPGRRDSLSGDRTFEEVRENALHKVKHNFYRETSDHQSTWTNEEKRRLKSECLEEIRGCAQFGEAKRIYSVLNDWSEACLARIPAVPA